MTNKTDKRFLFDVQVKWLADHRGVILSKKASGTVHVATPPEFGGEGHPWTPEHLFLSSISSCVMTTYLAFAKKMGFIIADFDCEAIGQVEIVEGKYKFSHIDLYPKVYVASEELREKAGLALEKTHKYCLISNSVNAAIFYHSEVIVADKTQALKNEVGEGTPV